MTPSESPKQEVGIAEAPIVKPIIIAGPCSAESREQVFATANALADAETTYFRAGIWKPRTRPDSFEGVGEIGLEWLRDAKSEFDIRPATEVANARHVELALEYGLDMVWIGARTTVNPFAVQEIADALAGVDIPVMVKNPINPDLGLWIGAVERIQRAGIQNVMACHRGFNIYGKQRLRNAPLWEIPIELRRQFPEIAMICDPSHIAGKREFIEEIATKAANLGYEGLMIETHPNPAVALSDAQQQLVPEVLLSLLKKLNFRRHNVEDVVFKNMLAHLRTEIDNLDDQLLRLLSDRMEVSRKIGQLKKNNNVAFYQHNRWTEIIEYCKENAGRLNLNEAFILKLFSLIHLESIDIQGE